jgi:hypothetical protein
MDIITHNLISMDNNFFEYFLSNGYRPNLETTKIFAENNELDKIKLCHKYGIKISGRSYTIASRKGNLEMLRWLYDNNIGYSNHFLVLCCSQNDKMVDVAKIQYQYQKLDIGTAFDNFVLIDSIEGLEYLKMCGYQIPISSIECAAHNGKLIALEWIKSQEIDIAPDIFAHAASGGQIEVMLWMSKNGYLCNIILAWELASQYGRLKAMKLLYNNSYEIPIFSYGTILYVCAFGGHLKSLKWLNSVYPVDFYGNPILRGAANGGKLKILKWRKSILAEKNMSLSDQEIKTIFISATDKKHTHILNWLYEEQMWSEKFETITQKNSM